jgi:hypothetical protein
MDDCIVCVLRNGFTAYERTIIEGGHPGRVIEMRQDFQRLMERRPIEEEDLQRDVRCEVCPAEEGDDPPAGR